MIIDVKVTRTVQTTITVGVEIFGDGCTLAEIRRRAIREISDNDFDSERRSIKTYSFESDSNIDLGSANKIDSDSPSRCAEFLPHAPHIVCELKKGHDGSHRDGAATWTNWCGAASPTGNWTCTKLKNHPETEHSDGTQFWRNA